MAVFNLFLHIFANQVHGYVTGAFDNYLYVVFPCNLCQFAENFQFAELSFIIGVCDAAGAQTISEGEGDIVLFEQLAYLFEMRIKEIFLLVVAHPFRKDRPSA